MVHAESDLIQIGVAVVLCYRTPSVAECIDAIVVLLLHTHILTDFADTVVYVGTETVGVAVSVVEREQVLVIFWSKILLEHRHDERFYSHLNVGFIAAAMTCFRSLVA